MPGPPRTPSNVVALTGNPGHRKAPKAEPQPELGMPDSPDWLDTEARAAWTELKPVLEKIRVVTEADAKALELLCDAYSEYRACREVVKREGATYALKTKKGEAMHRVRPEVAQGQDAWKRVRAMLAEFGLTPAARSKVTVLKETADDPYERFRRNRQG